MQTVFTIEDSQLKNQTSFTNSNQPAHQPTGHSSTTTDNSQPSVQQAVNPAPQQSTQCAPNINLDIISQTPVQPSSTGNSTNYLQSTQNSSHSAITNDHGASTSNLGGYEGIIIKMCIIKLIVTMKCDIISYCFFITVLN